MIDGSHSLRRTIDPQQGWEDLARVSRELVLEIRAAGASSEAEYATRLILEELVGNIIRYSRATKIDLHLRWEAHGGYLELVDDGQPFDPCTQPRPTAEVSIGGRGLPLVRLNSEDLDYERIEELNTVRLFIPEPNP